MKSPLKDENQWLDELSSQELEEYEHRYRWVALEARPEQITPPGDWKTWLYLAGRGAGKTRAAAEDVSGYGLDNPGSRIAVVAETFADGRDTCIEGESGLLSVLPEQSIRHWNRSLGELVLTNGTRYKIYSGDKPNQLRGPQHHRAWSDELAKFMYAEETWTQLQLGLRLGDNPQNIVTTTPRPIPLIRELVERENVTTTSGSTYDNAANLADSFLLEVRTLYEGTKLGDQELHGKIVELDGESIFKSEWFHGKNRYDPEDDRPWNRVTRRFVAIDTANTINETSAYSAMTVGDLQPDYTLPLRYVAREKLEFPELVDWTIEELAPFAIDRKLAAVFIEDAASGKHLIQTLRRSGPVWLRPLIVPVKPNNARGGKEVSWKAASVWVKRGMLRLPYPSGRVPWKDAYEQELFSVPNSTFKDQADSTAILINEIERRTGAFSQRWDALMQRAVRTSAA